MANRLRVPNRYTTLGEQRVFSAGMNSQWRNRVGPGQVILAENMRLHADRISKATGYEVFATPDFSGDNKDRWPVWALPSPEYNPTTLWVFWDGDAVAGGKVTSVSSVGTVTNYSTTVTNGHGSWCGLPLGGTEETPDVVLASNGDPTIGILDLTNPGAPAVWKADLALTSMIHWRNRIVGIVDSDANMYFSSPAPSAARPDWTTDVDDWEYLPIMNPNLVNRAIFMIDQNCYVLKSKGLARIENIEGDEVFREVPLSDRDGVQSGSGWCPIRSGKAVAFVDGRQIKMFDGNQVTQLSGEWNVEDELEALDWDYVCMGWDETNEILQVIFSWADETTSVGYDIYFRYVSEAGGKPAFVYRTYPRVIRSCFQTSLGATPRRMFYGAAGDSGGGTSPVLYRETQDAYLYGSDTYTSQVQLAPLELSPYRGAKVPAGRRWVHLRMVHLEMKTVIDDEVLWLAHRDGDGSWSTSEALPLNEESDNFRSLTIGVNRPGYYPQIRIADSGVDKDWALYGVVYEGLTRGQR